MKAEVINGLKKKKGKTTKPNTSYKAHNPVRLKVFCFEACC